ncbi:hypothetical protein CgunFtcFv8_011746 [Champsocephalus gunnari]|uniref:Uncharacterized protein n=1 Tax=Champsocephalus gunnari TaxID=52237 RepID=A0AAN8D7C4_CHAGU|nr:hypothetical protein CgunFtcFv8_011746 [Champsocephalus gunnari]
MEECNCESGRSCVGQRSGGGELCHSPSRVIGSRCEAAWPLRQRGVRAALRAQLTADGIAERLADPYTPPQKHSLNPMLCC